MKRSTSNPTDDSCLEKRMRQEIAAALRCNDAKAAAAHVELANRYLVKLSGLRTDDTI